MTKSTKNKNPPSKTNAELKSEAHHLKPVVQLGKKGITEAIFSEIDRALLDHELIKVQLHKDLKDQFDAICDEIADATSSTVVDRIGNIVILYKPREEIDD